MNELKFLKKHQDRFLKRTSLTDVVFHIISESKYPLNCKKIVEIIRDKELRPNSQSKNLMQLTYDALSRLKKEGSIYAPYPGIWLLRGRPVLMDSVDKYSPIESLNEDPVIESKESIFEEVAYNSLKVIDVDAIYEIFKSDIAQLEDLKKECEREIEWSHKKLNMIIKKMEENENV